MKNNAAAFLVFITVVFQHFRLFTVAGYEVTAGLIFGLLMLGLSVRQINYRLVISVWAFIFCTTASAALAYGETDAGAYVTTLALFLLSSFIIASAFDQQKSVVFNSNTFSIAVFCALLIIVGLSVGQVVLGSLGSNVLFNPFGDHQYLHRYKANIGLVQFPRAHGFFLEPSYNAFVIGSLVTTLLCLHRFTRVAIILGVLGLIACQSATGLVLLVIIAIIIAVRSRPAIALIALTIVSGVLVYSGEYLLLRLISSGTEGSSAYYRIFAPLAVLQDVLQTNPLGMPLGSVERTFSTYDLNMAGVQAKSLDNGFYVVIFYFGWPGVFLLIALLAAVLRYTSASGADGYSWVAPLWLFSSLFFSGGIMAPEFAIMSFFVIASFKYNRHGSLNNDKAAIEYSNSHLSRLGWPSRDNHVIGRIT